MFLVGYSIDFFSWIWAKVLPADLFTSMGVRIAVLIPALILFILAASFYMDVDMGTAPYDAVSFIISTHLPNVSFRVIRIVYDFVVTAIAVLLGGKLGIVTVLMVITLGPVIEWLGNIMKQHLDVYKRQLRNLDQTADGDDAWLSQLRSNMLRISMQKNLTLSNRIFCTTPKTIRERVLVYLAAQSAKTSADTFTIPFDRQGLADYLNLDRSALSKDCLLYTSRCV